MQLIKKVVLFYCFHFDLVVVVWSVENRPVGRISATPNSEEIYEYRSCLETNVASIRFFKEQLARFMVHWCCIRVRGTSFYRSIRINGSRTYNQNHLSTCNRFISYRPRLNSRFHIILDFVFSSVSVPPIRPRE